MAELWEVDTYILIPCYCGEQLCHTLQVQQQYLENFQKPKDLAEQIQLRLGNWLGLGNYEHTGMQQGDEINDNVEMEEICGGSSG